MKSLPQKLPSKRSAWIKSTKAHDTRTLFRGARDVRARHRHFSIQSFSLLRRVRVVEDEHWGCASLQKNFFPGISLPPPQIAPRRTDISGIRGDRFQRWRTSADIRLNFCEGRRTHTKKRNLHHCWLWMM